MRVPLMTMRDKKVLLELDDFGLMTSAQIKERVFAETRIRTVLRRLRILEKQKLIQRVYGLKGGALAWTVTSLGLKVIGPTKDASHVNKNTLEHDILFNEIRLSMERSGVTGKWRSGHSLRHSASANKQPWMRDENVIPDGILVASTVGSPLAIAIELEMHAKAKSRYRRIFDLYSDKKIGLLWYWVPTERFGKALAEQWENRTYRKDFIFAWSLVEECLGEVKNLRLRTYDKTIWFKELVSIKSESETAHTVAHRVSTSHENTNSIELSK